MSSKVKIRSTKPERQNEGYTPSIPQPSTEKKSYTPVPPQKGGNQPLPIIQPTKPSTSKK